MAKEKHYKIYTSTRSISLVSFGKYANKTFSYVARRDPGFFKEIKSLYFRKYDYLKKKAYKKVYKEFFGEEEVYDKYRQDIINKLAIDRKNGVLFSWSKKEIFDKYGDVPEAMLLDCFNKAKDTLRHEFKLEYYHLLDVHILRYEQMFMNAMNPDLSKVQKVFHNSVIIEGLNRALDAMIAKENLIGVHTNEFREHILEYFKDKNKDSEGNEEKKDFNLDRLSLNEQLELLSLIQFAKQEQHLSTETKVDKPEVLEVEELITTVDEKMQIEAPLSRSSNVKKKFDEEIESEYVSNSKSLSDVQNSIKETLRKQVEEAFKKNK